MIRFRIEFVDQRRNFHCVEKTMPFKYNDDDDHYFFESDISLLKKY